MVLHLDHMNRVGGRRGGGGGGGGVGGGVGGEETYDVLIGLVDRL